MTPFDTYQKYISLKNHFTKSSYDYFRYGGKVKVTTQSFYKRRDRYFFEKLSRKYNEKEIVDYFLSNFVSSTNPSGVWIGEIIKEGEGIYTNWKRVKDSLSYTFSEDSKKLLEDSNIPEIFDCSKGHPILFKKYLGKSITLETLVIYEKIFKYIEQFDKDLKDPVWESISQKIKKYYPFINIDIFKYKKILRELINE